jgi:uncharacterized membrane protein YedE/YeeE
VKIILALVFGAIFGLGIAISGMINPTKVLNFFDIAGTWDPSLAFVMIGALAVALPGYQLIFRQQKSPVLESRFATPSRTQIDAKLVGGAAIFGLGWGIAGFCPGGSIPALGLLNGATFLFVLALIGGIVAARLFLGRNA